MVKDGVDDDVGRGRRRLAVRRGDADASRRPAHRRRSRSPVLWWRSVGHSHTAFVDGELHRRARHAAGSDPLEYRRALLHEHPRHLGVLDLAAEKAGWGKPLAGRSGAWGSPCTSRSAAAVAQVAEVSVDGMAHPRPPRRLRRRLRRGREPGRRRARSSSRASPSGCRPRSTASITIKDGRVAAVELPRLPGAASARDAAWSTCTSCRAREKIGRRRRARHAADRAGSGQRDLRADRANACGRCRSMLATV